MSTSTPTEPVTVGTHPPLTLLRSYLFKERLPETRDEDHNFSRSENNLNIQIASTTYIITLVFIQGEDS
jgi:hypothetical protein